MSKKLLSENEVRRFMKLATIEPLANSFVDNASSVLREQMDDEEEMMGDEGPEDAGLPPAPPDGLEGEDAPGPMMGMDEESVARLVSAIADAIEDVTGVEVAVDGGEEEAPEDMEGAMDMGDMAPPDAMGAEAGMMGGAGADEEEMALQERANKLRNFIRSEIRSLMEEVDDDKEEDDELEEVKNLAKGEKGLAAQGGETGHGVAEKADAGPHSLKPLKRSKKDEGSHSASVVAEDRKVAEITRRVAARLLAASKSS
jgi:hypothetical protein